jgi:predicted enzyme related to lactoylglutathione lyase
MTAPGTFHWNELQSRNLKKAKDFYAKTLGWTYEDMPMGDVYGTYTIIKSGEDQVGGMFEMTGAMFNGMPEGWFTYVAVKDVDALMKKVTAAGGKVLREPWDVKGIGRIAIVQDANGATQGWMVPAAEGM